jgi:hypothetical protein
MSTMDEADRIGAEAAVRGAAVGEHPASVFGLVARSVGSPGQLDDAVEHAQQVAYIADAAG